MFEKQKTGKFGEDLAEKYLKDNGYKVIARNFRFKWGDEIDLIAVDRDRKLVFVEVKTIRKLVNNSEMNENNSEIYLEQDQKITPEDNLTRSKLRRLQRACNFYANVHLEQAIKGWQIDLIAIDVLENSLTIKSSKYDIRHYENI